MFPTFDARHVFSVVVTVAASSSFDKIIKSLISADRLIDSDQWERAMRQLILWRTNQSRDNFIPRSLGQWARSLCSINQSEFWKFLAVSKPLARQLSVHFDAGQRWRNIEPINFSDLKVKQSYNIQTRMADGKKGWVNIHLQVFVCVLVQFWHN